MFDELVKENTPPVRGCNCTIPLSQVKILQSVCDCTLKKNTLVIDFFYASQSSVPSEKRNPKHPLPRDYQEWDK